MTIQIEEAIGLGRTVRQHDARTNITYVYEVIEAHYDPDKKQARSKRKLIGKLDENGNVIPTGPKGRPKGSTQENSEKATANLTRYYKDLLNEKDADIKQKSAENNLLSEKLKEAEKTLQRYKSAIKASEKIWAGLA